MARPEAHSNKRRILVVDNHAVVRYALSELVSKENDLCVCGEEDSASRAIESIKRVKPDLVIVDISLKKSSGLELLRNLKAQYPGLPGLVLSAHDESTYADVAFRAGARGYLMKNEPLERIIAAIRCVLSGQIYVSNVLAAKMLKERVQGRTNVEESPLKKFSDREFEVFKLIGEWKTTRQIAAELHLSTSTIDSYRDSIKQKLNVETACQLTRRATSWVEGTLAE